MVLSMFLMIGVITSADPTWGVILASLENRRFLASFCLLRRFGKRREILFFQCICIILIYSLLIAADNSFSSSIFSRSPIFLLKYFADNWETSILCFRSFFIQYFT